MFYLAQHMNIFTTNELPYSHIKHGTFWYGRDSCGDLFIGLYFSFLHCACSNVETFFQDFLSIPKRMLQN